MDAPKWQVTELCVGWGGQFAGVVALNPPRDAASEFLEKLSQDPLIGGYHLQLIPGAGAATSSPGTASP